MKSKDQPVELIGVPLDHGAGQKRGRHGPDGLANRWTDQGIGAT